MNILSFREYLALREFGPDPNMDPAIAMQVQKKAQAMNSSPIGNAMDAGDLVNKAAKDVALKPGANPATVAKLYKPKGPAKMMMKKHMKRTMEKK